MTATTLERFFTSEYMPHGHCYMWQPHILWTNVIADLLIATAYFSIPIAIIIVYKQRPDIAYRKVFLLFSLFILMCGITHIFGIVTIWQGIYGWHGVAKSITAIVSITTAWYLYRKLPDILLISTPTEIAGIKQALKSESQHRERLSLQIEQQQLVKFMLDTMPISACLLDKNGNVLLSNEAFNDETEYQLPHDSDLTLTSLLQPDNVTTNAFISDFKEMADEDSDTMLKIQSIVSIQTRRGQVFRAETTLVKEYFNNTPLFVITFNNLSEIESVRQELLQSHSKLERALKATEDGVWEWNINDGSMTWSDMFSDLLGVSHLDPHHIDTWLAHIHPEHRGNIEAQIANHFESKERLNIEYLGKNKSGQYGWFSFIGNTVFDANDKPVIMSGSLRSIDDNKVLEKQVAEKNSLLNTIYEGSNNAIWVITVEPNREFRFLVFNRTASERIGITTEQVVGASLTDLAKGSLPSETVERLRDNYQSCVDIKGMLEYTESFPSNQGLRWYRTALYPILNSDGNVIKIVGSAIDITPVKETEHQLAENKQFLENIIDASICGIRLFDFTLQKTTRINQRYKDLLGHSLEDLQGLDDPISIYHPDDIIEISKHIELVIGSQPGDLYPIQYRVKHKDGHWVWCHTVNTIIKRDENNNPVIMLTTFIDVTEQINLLTKLKQSNSYLERFALVASHDLQEPLRKISTFADMLSERLASHLADDEDSAYQFDRIKNAADRMRIMINDIMGLSQINSAMVHKTRISLREMIDYASDQLQLIIEENDARISIENGDILLSADRSLMGQLIQNLLTNAIKFKSADNPKISVSAQTKGSSTIVSIMDNGIGMEPRFCQQIFEPFRRLHSKDKYDGSGIGLAIAKQVIDVHGGTIECQSEVGVGTTFTLTLPK